jgi:hypothetical protein
MPQPIDMQSELARSLLADRVQDVASRASVLGQLRVSNETERQRRAAETSTQETARAQSEHIERDGKRQHPFARRRSKSGQETRSEQPEPEAYGPNAQTRPSEGAGNHALDVSV